MIIKKMVLFVLLPLLISIMFFSCSENPVGPVIRHIWGTSDYFPYEIYMNWKYEVEDPGYNLDYELWHYVDEKVYIQPDSGWAVVAIIDDIPLYYFLIAERLDGIYRHTSESGWLLEYELPFVIGSKWNLESSFTDSLLGEVTEKIDVEVLDREKVSVIAGTYEDCVKLKMDVSVSIVDTAGNDSSYYYKQYEWYAPNVGLVKWVIYDSDIPEMVGGNGMLKKKFKEYYFSGSGGFQSKIRNRTRGFKMNNHCL
jgi:hypothetical protein